MSYNRCLSIFIRCFFCCLFLSPKRELNLNLIYSNKLCSRKKHSAPVWVGWEKKGERKRERERESHTIESQTLSMCVFGNDFVNLEKYLNCSHFRWHFATEHCVCFRAFFHYRFYFSLKVYAFYRLPLSPPLPSISFCVVFNAISFTIFVSLHIGIHQHQHQSPKHQSIWRKNATQLNAHYHIVFARRMALLFRVA